MSDTPDQPLRADATDEQMRRRYWFFRDTASPTQDITAIPLAIAREFAKACVAAERKALLGNTTFTSGILPKEARDA